MERVEPPKGYVLKDKGAVQQIMAPQRVEDDEEDPVRYVGLAVHRDWPSPAPSVAVTAASSDRA
jgi:hypothetical protein